jgi:hypothetical protein
MLIHHYLIEGIAWSLPRLALQGEKQDLAFTDLIWQ